MNNKNYFSFLITKFRFKIFVLIIFLILFSGNTQIFSQDEIEIVESIPLETSLENSDLPRTLNVWLKMINEAKESVDIETFYFANEKGKPLEQIIAALKDAAGRGVIVRIIVDSGFYSKNDKSVDELEGIKNITIKKIPFSNLAGGVMHAKYFIADKINVFTGSQNFDWRALIHIHEIGIRVKNKDMGRTFSELFETDWKLCDNNFYGITNMAVHFFVNKDNPVTVSSDKYGQVMMYPAFSPPDLNMPGLSSEEDELIKIIDYSKNRLLIQMYSYSPKTRSKEIKYDRIDNALRSAASRGVKVKIIFSDWAIRDEATDFIKSLSAEKNIEIKFSSIPQSRAGFIPYSRVEHCKYFISDNNISWISSSNWEQSYFKNSRNATIVTDNIRINEELEKVFYRSWDSNFTEKVDIDRKYESVKRN
ncbi:MAG: phospholipase D-like domain-containing protein [Ignavibacteria bacterium]